MSITSSIIYPSLFRQSNYPDLIIFLNDDIYQNKTGKFFFGRSITKAYYDLLL